jgi:hypothetical protein
VAPTVSWVLTGITTTLYILYKFLEAATLPVASTYWHLHLVFKYTFPLKETKAFEKWMV